MTTYTAIDLFSGAGGLSEGFAQAGFQILAANDFDQYAAETFKATHRDANFIDGPVQKITANQLLKAAGLKKGELFCLIGGPPCQAFSVYNHQRGMHDERSGLFREYLRLVEGVSPEWVIMENVTGMTSVANGQAINEIRGCLQSLGYSNFEFRQLKAEEYGVPQERRRLFFIANRSDQSIPWPEPTNDGEHIPFNSVADAIFDLPQIENGGGEAEQKYPKKTKLTSYQLEMRNGGSSVYNHIAPRLSPTNLERMKHIPQGGSWRDIPRQLLPAGMQKAKRSDHTKRYGRLHPKGLSSTILTKCDIHWGAYIHPLHDRALTVREAARFQSFPDSFVFQGPRTEQYRQVGNAVPPLLGKSVAEAIINHHAN